MVPGEWPPPMFPLPPREPKPPKRAHGGRVDGHEAREKELIGELARMNRHRAMGGPVNLAVSQFPGQHRRRALGGPVTSSTPSRQALAREQRNQGPGTLGEVSDVMMQQQRLLNPLYGRPAPNAPPGYARGGKAGHAPYLVGEKGPELMVPDTPGTIIPNHELRRLVKKYGGGRVHR
jgi:hypothetical protein